MFLEYKWNKALSEKKPFNFSSLDFQAKKDEDFFLRFSNSIYQGSTVKGVPDGIGAAFFHTGELYFGSFSRGLFHGEGVFFFCQGGLFLFCRLLCEVSLLLIKSTISLFLALALAIDLVVVSVSLAVNDFPSSSLLVLSPLLQERRKKKKEHLQMIGGVWALC